MSVKASFQLFKGVITLSKSILINDLQKSHLPSPPAMRGLPPFNDAPHIGRIRTF